MDDKDKYVRIAAIKALGRRTILPDEIIMAIAAHLEDKDSHVRSVAFDLLTSQLKSFPSVFCKGSVISPLYETLLERSFKEQISCYFVDGTLWVNTSEGTEEMFVDIRESEVMEWIHGARPEDYPSTSGAESPANSH